jgi:hypothetical protein
MANRPGPDARVWRYMPFSRFRDLVHTSELNLHRLDKLEDFDPHEGRWLEGVEDLRFTDGVDDPQSLVAALELERTRTFVSCWTLRLKEMTDMWNRFEPLDEPVAIVAVYRDLIASLSASTLSLAIGGVCYMDTLAEFVERFDRVNTYNLPFCKRSRFREEQEVRVVHQQDSAWDLGSDIRAAIDLGQLRPRVVLPPLCTSELTDRVTEVLAFHDYQWEVRPSSL